MPALASYAQNFEDLVLDRVFADRLVGDRALRGCAAGFHVNVGAGDPLGSA